MQAGGHEFESRKLHGIKGSKDLFCFYPEYRGYFPGKMISDPDHPENEWIPHCGILLSFNYTGLCNMLIPVRALFGITLLRFEINVEETVAFFVSVGPGEHIH